MKNMEINLDLIKIQNPWWESKTIKFDPVLEKYNSQKLQWEPDVIKKIKFDKNFIYCIQGPRGVGKTTVLKLLIKRLLRKKYHKNILYYSCHNLNTYEQLNLIIKEFVNWRLKEKINRGKLYILIDEISLIKKWQKGLFYLQNAGVFKNATLIVSGSVLGEEENNISNKYWQELTMSSLSFHDFIRLINPKIADSKLQREAWHKKWQNQLGYYFDIYLLTGGFISAINSFNNMGGVKQGIYSNFLYWQTLDIAKMGRDIFLFKQLMEKIINNIGQPVGYKTLARHTKAKTHLTVAEYINILESIFTIKVVYQSDSKMHPSKSKAKKIFFQDPFLFWLFYSHIHGALSYWQFSRESLHTSIAFKPFISNVIFSQLIKSYEQVLFWRNVSTKKEIDFVVKNKNNQIIPIINAYKDKNLTKHKQIFKQAGFSKGIIVTADKLKLKGKIKEISPEYFIYNYKKILET